MAINWDAFGAIAEALGAFAVILSVLYLATQIRSQISEARLSATRNLATEVRQVLQSIALDHEFSEIYQAGLYDYKNLPDNDRMRVSYIFQVLLGICQQQYLHTQQGSIDAIYLASAERSSTALFKYPGVQEFWSLSKDGFGDDFSSHIDKLIAEAQTMDFTSSFNHQVDTEKAEVG